MKLVTTLLVMALAASACTGVKDRTTVFVDQDGPTVIIVCPDNWFTGEGRGDCTITIVEDE